MNFEVDRYSSAWAHIALCADLTWATEPPDDFIIANQRLLAQHCRVSQVLQDATLGSLNSTSNNQSEFTDRHPNTSQSQENGNYNVQRSVKEVIPESRLAQFYGNFYYNETREKCYTNANDKSNGRGYSGQGCESPDLTECWMLPEVEYWFRKLVDDTCERGVSLRRRHCRMAAEDDLCVLTTYRHLGSFTDHVNKYTSSERWGSGARAAGEEAALAARVLSVRPLWTPAPPTAPRPPTPPPTPRKMRARRRQPRRLAVLAPPPPAYCIDAPAQLLCDPTCKFEFDSPRPLQLADCQRAIGRLSASVQAVMRASAARCPPYRGTNVSRYAPTSQRPARGPDRRYGIWWPRNHPSPRLDQQLQLTQALHNSTVAKKYVPQAAPKTENEECDKKESTPEEKHDKSGEQIAKADEPQTPPQKSEQPEESKTAHEKVVVDDQMPSTSTAAMEIGLRKKRLYSTVLSMSAPTSINLAQVGCVRLPQKLVAPGLLKLNTKIVLPATRLRPPVVDNKFEELEKEALEQYKASDESIDTKFRELEKEAVEQYSASNSNTSCSSGNSAEKRPSSSPSAPENDPKKKQPVKFHKDKAVDSVVIYSQNFPDLNAKAHPNLKNFHTPLRGEKKEQAHRLSRVRNLKSDPQRAASDTDYEARDSKTNCKGNNHKGSMRWTLHVVPPKKRHLTFCVSDFSSDEEFDGGGSIRDAGPRMKSHVTSKMKMSAHGGGDLEPIMRKT